MKRKMFLAITMICGVLLASCEKMDVKTQSSGGEQKSSAATSEEQPATTALTPGTVATIVVGDAPFSVEIAETDEERAKGLMNRESLAANSGMWFVFPQMGSEKFWMKDTLIPLDLIFVDNNMKVVHVIKNAPAMSTEILSSPASFQYVLEVNAGTADNKGIAVGDTVEKRIGPN